MTRVYGGCIEPGGIELDSNYETLACPDCGSPALHWTVERAEAGSINLYSGLRCDSCGLTCGDEPDD